MATSDQTAVRTAPGSGLPARTRRRRFVRWLRTMGWRHLVAWVALAFALGPILVIIKDSLSPIQTLNSIGFLPSRFNEAGERVVSFTTNNYTALFEGCSWDLGLPPFGCDSTTPVPLWLWNTVKVAVFATSIQLVFSALAAYSFARLRWKGRRTGLIIILLIQMFPQFLAFVAIFLLLDTLQDTFGEARQVDLWIAATPVAVAAIGLLIARARGLLEGFFKKVFPYTIGVAVGLVAWALSNPDFGVTIFPTMGFNTHTGLILVYLGGAVGVNTWLIKGFMDSIPLSLDEAAKVDGATEWDIFAKIIVPLTKPILIVIFILSFVGLYNEFILAQILIQDVDQFTYAPGLALFVESDFAGAWGELAAAALIGATPIILLFLFLQDRIVGGLGGAVKG